MKMKQAQLLLFALLASSAAQAVETGEVFFQNGRKTYVEFDAELPFCKMSDADFSRRKSRYLRISNFVHCDPVRGNFGTGEIYQVLLKTEDGRQIDCIS